MNVASHVLKRNIGNLVRTLSSMEQGHSVDAVQPVGTSAQPVGTSAQPVGSTQPAMREAVCESGPSMHLYEGHQLGTAADNSQLTSLKREGEPPAQEKKKQRQFDFSVSVSIRKSLCVL